MSLVGFAQRWRARACAGLIASILLSGNITASLGESLDEGGFQECSKHCGSEHAGEQPDMKLCVELCRLFDFPEPATLD